MYKRANIPSVKAEFFKALYIGCLEKLDLADVVRIFSASLDGLPCKWDAGRLAGAIWHEKGTIPLDFYLSFLEYLEKTLIQKRILPDKFLLDTIVSTNNGAMVSSPTVLYFIGSFLSRILTMNLRELLLDTIVRLNSYIFKGIHTEILRKTKNENCLEYLVLTKLPSTIERKVIAATWLKPLFHSLGTAFGFPPIEEVDVLSETYSIDEMRMKGFIDKDGFEEILASSTTMTFGEFTSGYGISLPAQFAFADAVVTRSNRTVQDHAMGREIAFKGCAYGAPLFLFRINAKRKYSRNKFSLNRIIESAIGSKASNNARFEQRHKRVAAIVGKVPVVTFTAGSEELFVNDQLVCCGVPARILAAMLRARNSAGMYEFCKDDFARDSRILKNKLDKSFNINIKRAMNHANAKMPFVSIERHVGTGKVMMKVTGEFQFKA